MRNRMVSGASFLVVVAIATGLAAFAVDDRYGERLDGLETRVARLEALAGIPTPTAEVAAAIDGDDGVDGKNGQDGEDGEDGSVSISSGSSSSTSSQGNNSSSYSASYSSTGDRTQPFEIDREGVYFLTAHGSAPLSVRVETTDGEEIPDFTAGTDDAGTLSVSGELEPGEYVLTVESESQWTVIITSMGE